MKLIRFFRTEGAASAVFGLRCDVQSAVGDIFQSIFRRIAYQLAGAKLQLGQSGEIAPGISDGLTQTSSPRGGVVHRKPVANGPSVIFVNAGAAVQISPAAVEYKDIVAVALGMMDAVGEKCDGALPFPCDVGVVDDHVDGADELGGKAGSGDAAGYNACHGAGHSHGDGALAAGFQSLKDLVYSDAVVLVKKADHDGAENGAAENFLVH